MTLPAEQTGAGLLLARLSGAAPIETHISAVFVGADTVWKLLRAVRLPFLDFTNLAERERVCRRALALNAPHAPGLYRDVVPVTRGEAGLQLGGPGTPVDWVLRMARVPPADFLDRIAESGGLTPALLDQLGDTIAAFHAALSTSHGRPHAQAMRAIAEGNRVSALAAGLPPEAVARWHTDITAMIDCRQDWLAARAASGFVRRAHGDLHLGNLCLWHAKPTLFDALEFDEDLATIDLGYDLAFLLMDLEQRCGRQAANRVFNRYVARTGDVDLVAGLPLFLSMRAMVRAHVTARSGGSGLDYLARALAMLRPPKPRAIAIGGLPGTGKSTLARRLAPALGASPGALILRSDEVRKRRFHLAPEARLPEAAYTKAVSNAVMASLCAGMQCATKHGHCVIADASFIAARDRDAIEAAAAGVPFEGLWLHAPLDLLAARIRARHGDASDADEAVLRRAATSDLGQISWALLASDDAHAIDTAVENITKSA